jgi:hypothetical protein
MLESEKLAVLEDALLEGGWPPDETEKVRLILSRRFALVSIDHLDWAFGPRLALPRYATPAFFTCTAGERALLDRLKNHWESRIRHPEEWTL